jgi:hypothetical protein
MNRTRLQELVMTQAKALSPLAQVTLGGTSVDRALAGTPPDVRAYLVDAGLKLKSGKSKAPRGKPSEHPSAPGTPMYWVEDFLFRGDFTFIRFP